MSKVAASNWTSKIVKESGIGLAGSVVGTALNYVVLFTVTRFLGPRDFGVFSLAQSIVAVSLIFVLLGTPRALDRFIPCYGTDDGGLRKVKGLIYGIFRITSLTSALMILVLVAVSRWLSFSVFRMPDLAVVLRLMAFTVPPLATMELVSLSFIGFKELRYRVYTHYLAAPLLKIGFALVVFSVGLGLVGWVWAYVGAVLLTAALALTLFWRHIGAALRRVGAIPLDLREVLSYSWPLSVSNLVLMFSGHLSILLLGHFRPAAEVGVYRVYVYIVMLLVLARSSFAQIYKPVTAELSSRRMLVDIADVHKRVGKWMLIVGAFLSPLVVLLGGDGVRLLFPAKYAVAPVALIVLALGRLVVSSLGPQEMTLEAFGNTLLSMLNAIILMAITLGLGWVLIPKHGVVGAALATALGSAGAAVAGFVEVRLIHRVHPFGRAYSRVVLAAAAAWAAAFALKRALGTGGFGVFAAVLALFCLVYGLGLRYLAALDAVDYEVLRRIRARMFKPAG